MDLDQLNDNESETKKHIWSVVAYGMSRTVVFINKNNIFFRR